MNEYEQVGPTIRSGDVLIDDEAAEQFRLSALLGTKLKKLTKEAEFTHIQTASYASGILSDAFGDFNVSDEAVYAKSTYGANPDFWRSVITFTRIRKDDADLKIYNRYEVEAHDGEVAVATRRVRILRNFSRIALDEDDEPVEEVYKKERKKYETLMRPEDIELVSQKMERIIHRQHATARRGA